MNINLPVNIMNTIIPHVVRDRLIDTSGLDWTTAKFRLYALNKAPKGDANELDGTTTLDTTYPTGDALVQYKTKAAHGMIGDEYVVLSGMHASGSRVFGFGTNYAHGDIVQANVQTGRPNNDWLHSCVFAGDGGSTTQPMLWAPNPSGISTHPNEAGPSFRNMGLRKHEWPCNGVYELTPTLATGTYADAGNLKFRVRTYNTGNRYPGVSWVADADGNFGYVYPLHKYLDQWWTSDASIVDMSDPLLGRVVRTGGVLDSLDTIIDLGTENSKNIIMLLVRVADLHEDTVDLPYSQQEVIAMWAHGRNIGNLYSSDNFTGSALISISNMVQLQTPMVFTETASSEGA